MINKTVDYFENKAKQLGLTIKLPRPNRTAKSISSATNGLIGIALISSGTLLKKPALVVLGALGVAGAVALLLDDLYTQQQD